jgi:putative serine protease PepD
MLSRRTTTATLLAGAVLSGAVGGGAVTLADGGGGTTTVTTAAATATPVASSAPSTATARDIYRKASGSVVQITADSTGSASGSESGNGDSPFSSPFGGGSGGQGGQGGSGGSGASEATGTGFVVDSSGLIVTNEHVIDGASKITVTLSNGDDLRATLVGKDTSSDLALLRVSPGSHTLTALKLADDSSVQVGDTAYAIGSPYGLGGTLTTGVVSALNRQIDAPNGFTIAGALQTDAELNPGNSGGPLLNTQGQVIGVNSQVYSSGSSSGGEATGGTGLGFAIPSSTVKRVVAALRADGKVQHAYLGLSMADAPNDGGATVGALSRSGPAADAGLKAGDVITAVDGAKVTDGGDLAAQVAAHAPGDRVTLTVTRSGATKTIHVTLGTQPSQAAA